MPNLSAAKKSLRSDSRKYVHNLRRKRAMKTAVKEVRTLAKNAIQEAGKKLPLAYKALDKAAKSGIIKKNTASRIKSRLSKLLTKAA